MAIDPTFEEIRAGGLDLGQIAFDPIKTPSGDEYRNLGDAYRSAVELGAFQDLRSNPQARAEAFIKQYRETGKEPTANINPQDIPMSGDLGQLSEQYGVGQNTLIDLRRQRGGGISGAEGVAGDMENQSYAERTALPSEGTPTGKVTSYFDNQRGVKVVAPPGKHFVTYANGAVREGEGIPTAQEGQVSVQSSLFGQPTAGGKPVEGYKNENLGYQPIAGKTIAETAQSIFNPITKVDEYANPGEVLIRYTDGTVERRKVGGTPGEAVTPDKFGRTTDELGLNPDGSQKLNSTKSVDQIIAEGGSREDVEAAITKAGLAPTSSLELIGSDYQPLGKDGQPTGPRRRAKEGYAFYQEPGSDTILERPVSQQGLAKPTTSPSILAERKKLESKIQEHLPGEDTTQLEQDFQENPMSSFAKMYAKLQEAQGVSTIKSEIEKIQAEQKTLDEKYADEQADIDSNPWLSESLRSRKQNAVASKYETQKAQLTARLQMNSTLLQNARQESQFIASNALEQYNADRTFDFNMLKYEAERQDAQMDAEYKLMTLAQNAKNANIKEVQGGLYDIGNKKWIIPPKEDSVSPNTIAGIISDVYQTYDPDEANTVMGDIMGQIGNIGQPLSIQSIVPKGQSIGTKFGEQTFAQAHHSGVDLPATMGSPVLAPVEMNITSVGAAGGYGNAITAVGSDGLTYRFAHLSGMDVKPGATVKAGQLIGKVGSTGISTGPHLHMEVMKDGKFIDPVDHFGLTSNTQPIKTKAQKAAEVKEVEAKKKDAADKNNELVKSDTYKTIRKAQDSLQFLNSFNDMFKKYGTTSQVTSPFDNSKLAASYNATILNLKEFFNLGVLNGPDEKILRGVLPDPTGQGLVTSLSAKSATRSGIDNMKKMIEATLDDRYQSLVSQYSGYSTGELGALKDVQRIYLNQKATLNPEIKNKINQIKSQNPGLTDEEIIQIIL